MHSFLSWGVEPVLLHRYLLPFAFPLSVLLIGSWRMAVTRAPETPRESAASTASARPSQTARPDYRQPPPGTQPSCDQDPSLGNRLLEQGRRLGITVVFGEPELPGKDASYRAMPGQLGTITFKQRPMADKVRCKLISHEFIHVLQHLHGDLKGVPPLGWPTTHPDPVVQEAEAYGHQNRAGYVLELLESTPSPR